MQGNKTYLNPYKYEVCIIITTSSIQNAVCSNLLRFSCSSIQRSMKQIHIFKFVIILPSPTTSFADYITLKLGIFFIQSEVEISVMKSFYDLIYNFSLILKIKEYF